MSIYIKEKYNIRKEQSDIRIIVLFLIINCMFISNMIYYYEMPIQLFSQKFNLLMIGILCGISFLGYFIRRLAGRKSICILNSALVFWGGSIFSTLINYSIYSNNDIIISLVYQTFWCAMFISSYILVERANNIDRFMNIAVGMFWMISGVYYTFKLIGREYPTAGAINSIYYVVLMLPFVLMVKKYPIKVAGISVCIFEVLLSQKRTALIIVIIALFSYILIEFLIGNSKNHKKLYSLIALFALIIIGVYMYNVIVERYNLDILLRLKMLETDGGSGRNLIYSQVWESQKGSNIIQWIFGRGYNGVYLTGITNTSAHNDFLEILFDYGLVGVGMYITFICRIVKYSYQLYKIKHCWAPAFIASISIFVIMSFFSHLIIYPTYIIYLLIFWSICIVKIERWKINNESYAH